MLKGLVKDDDWGVSKSHLHDGVTLMLMGTAGDITEPVHPVVLDDDQIPPEPTPVVPPQPKEPQVDLELEKQYDPPQFKHISKMAGGPLPGMKDGPAPYSRFRGPRGLCITDDSLAYVADTDNNCIRVVKEGHVGTLAGHTNTAGFKDGSADKAQFNHPSQVALDRHSGALYVADTKNCRIRLVKNGAVSTVAGTGVAGYDDGPTGKATFTKPEGIVIDAHGILYVSDATRVRKVELAHGGAVVSTVASGFVDLAHIAIDPQGTTLYVCDFGDHCVKMIKDGHVSMIAGSNIRGIIDGPAASAKFYGPSGITVDDKGTIYLSDTPVNRVRMIKEGRVATIAGNEGVGFNNGTASEATFTEPYGVALDPHYRFLYIADKGNNAIRVLDLGHHR